MGNQTVDGPHSLPYYEVEDQNSIKIGVHCTQINAETWSGFKDWNRPQTEWVIDPIVQLSIKWWTPAVNKQNHRSEEKHIAWFRHFFDISQLPTTLSVFI